MTYINVKIEVDNEGMVPAIMCSVRKLLILQDWRVVPCPTYPKKIFKRTESTTGVHAGVGAVVVLADGTEGTVCDPLIVEFADAYHVVDAASLAYPMGITIDELQTSGKNIDIVTSPGGIKRVVEIVSESYEDESPLPKDDTTFAKCSLCQNGFGGDMYIICRPPEQTLQEHHHALCASCASDCMNYIADGGFCIPCLNALSPSEQRCRPPNARFALSPAFRIPSSLIAVTKPICSNVGVQCGDDIDSSPPDDESPPPDYEPPPQHAVDPQAQVAAQRETLPVDESPPPADESPPPADESPPPADESIGKMPKETNKTPSTVRRHKDKSLKRLLCTTLYFPENLWPNEEAGDEDIQRCGNTFVYKVTGTDNRKKTLKVTAVTPSGRLADKEETWTLEPKYVHQYRVPPPASRVGPLVKGVLEQLQTMAKEKRKEAPDVDQKFYNEEAARVAKRHAGAIKNVVDFLPTLGTPASTREEPILVTNPAPLPDNVRLVFPKILVDTLLDGHACDVKTLMENAKVRDPRLRNDMFKLKWMHAMACDDKSATEATKWIHKTACESRNCFMV